MTTKRFDTEQVIGFNDTTESVNIIPEAGVTYTVAYKSGDTYVDDEKGEQSFPSRVFVQNTVTRITPVGGHVTVNGAGTFYVKKSSTPIQPPQPVDNYDNVVFIGASIMAGAFGQDLVNDHAPSTSYLNNGTKVYGFGWSGEKYDFIKDKIDEAITAFAGTNTLFIAHPFGNNVTGDRPLENNNAIKRQEWNDMLDDIYSRTSSVRNDFMVAAPTFRNYDGTTLYDIDKGSFPYIAEYFAPRRNPKFENTDGKDILDLHELVRENNQWLLPDGIHMADHPSFRNAVLDRIRYLTDGTGQKPAPIQRTIPLDDPNKPPATPTDAIIVNFGTASLTEGFQGTTLTAEAFNAHNSRRLKTGQGFYTDYTMRTFSSTGDAGNNASGRTLSTPYDDTLLSDPLHSNCIYLPSTGELTFSGFNADQVVEVSFIATKNGSDNYLSRMEEDGNPSNFVEYETTQVTPSAPTPISVTADSTGSLTVLVKEVDFRNGYLGAIKINPI